MIPIFHEVVELYPKICEANDCLSDELLKKKEMKIREILQDGSGAVRFEVPQDT